MGTTRRRGSRRRAASARAKRGYHHGDLRHALVDAAARLAAERGVTLVTLREVARRAGVSHAAPYHHFADRDALLAAVAEEGFRRLDVAGEEAMRRAAAADPATRLRVLGVAYVRFAVGHPHYFRVMFRPDVKWGEQYPALGEVAGRTFDRLVAAVRACLPRERASREDALRAAIFAWSAVHGLASLWLDGPLAAGPAAPAGIEPLIDQVTSAAVRAIAAPETAT